MNESVRYDKLMDRIKNGIAKTKEEKEVKRLSVLLNKDQVPDAPDIQIVYIPVKEKISFWKWLVSFSL